MPTRYRTIPKALIKKPQADDEEYYIEESGNSWLPTVDSWDSYTEDTGLVDANGDPIMREVSPNPVGFGHIY